MKQKGNYITEDKKKMLEAELVDLKGPKRKEILEALKSAKAMGDLSENAEYHQAREDQSQLESSIGQIEEILRSSEVVPSETHGDVITIGSEVVVLKEGSKEEKVFKIVGSEETNMAEGKISNRSPLGSALFNKKVGDKVVVNTPMGKVNYEIKKVS